MTLQPGTRLGPYEILAALGAGGMGEVYRARDTKLQREVAIKALPPQFVSDPDRAARFEREAQALAALNHPGIGGIHELLEHEGSRFLVLEYVDGVTLAAMLADGALALDDLLPIARQIVDALEAAHDKGIVHRDLKPANVMIASDGRVKVLDFGLAKALDGAGGADRAGRASGAGREELLNSPTITSPAFTQTGMILGTAAYMSPEQARGKPVDRRADIWAFGCVLYEMLTGAQAFGGETVSDTIGAIMRGEPDWTRLPASTPSAVRRLLRRCLTKDVQQRLPHIGVARLDLSDAGDGPSGPIVTTRARAARWPWVIAGVAVAAFAAAAAALWMRPDATPTANPLWFEIDPPPGASRFGHILSNRGTNPPAPHFAVSPDGRRIAFVALTEPSTVNLWVHSLANGQARRLPGTEDAAFPFWSPDGRDVAFFAEGSLKRINVEAGSPLTIAAAPGGEGGTWAPDGTILFHGNDSRAVRRVSANGGVPTDTTSPEQGIAHRYPFFLPDGRQFIYTATRAQGSTVRLRSLDSSDDIELAPTEGRAVYASGHLLFAREQRLFAQRFDPRTRALDGTPVVVAERLAVNPSAVRAGVHASEGGVLAVRQTDPQSSERLEWRARDGKVLEEIDRGNLLDVSLSPDGTRAIVGISPAAGLFRVEVDLWLYDLTRKVKTRFTSDAGVESNAVWSPDGSAVWYAVGVGLRNLAKATIWTKPAGGAGTPKPLNAVGVPTSVTPDGGTLLIVGSNDALLRMPARGGDATRLFEAEAPVAAAKASPDGRWIAYVSTESGFRDVYVQPMPPNGERFRISPDGGHNPRWSRSGRELYFVSRSLQLSSVAMTPRGPSGKPETLFDLGSGAYAPAPDDQRFLVIAEQDEVAASPPLTVIVNWTQLLTNK